MLPRDSFITPILLNKRTQAFIEGFDLKEKLKTFAEDRKADYSRRKMGICRRKEK